MTLLTSLLGAAAPGARPFLPAPASSVADGVDDVFMLLFWLSAFFLALILVLTVLFVLRYRQRAARPAPEPSPAHHTPLELLWTGIPLALVLVVFVASTRTYSRMTAPPEGEPLRVQVTARKWSWWFDHPGGKGAPELHLVAGRPAELLLASSDVIHSLYVPEFRLKQDAVPGRFTRMTFTPVLPGTYPVLCAEYCGTDHSRMLTTVVVHPDQAAFDAWAGAGAPPAASLVDRGREVFAARGCGACHSLDGSRRIGPTVKGLWHKEERMADGTTARVDEDYLREAVLRPGARVVAGYPNVMPPVALGEDDLQALVAYLRSLAEEAP